MGILILSIHIEMCKLCKNNVLKDYIIILVFCNLEASKLHEKSIFFK
jgi:hypothetical protein